MRPQSIQETTVPKADLHRVTVKVPSDLLQNVRELAQEHERSVAAEIRWVLRAVTENPSILEG